ncbi:MAG: DUF192 domain-containing protein [Patescibacteria group bacterium]|nr:DUF192 domain-containing protein [Patescibacteria group bacterium]
MEQNLRKKVNKVALVLMFLLLSAACNKQSPAQDVTDGMDARYNHELQIGNKILEVQVVNTPQDMQQGLSGRTSLANNKGMLFDFGQQENNMPYFWMKDMNFNLDLIWIKNNKIVGITKNVPKPEPGTPDSQLPFYSPPSPIDSVLEVNAGWADRNGIKAADEVDFK